jgi:azurin
VRASSTFCALLVAGFAVLGAGELAAQSSIRAAPDSTVTVGTLGDELAYDAVEIRARAGSEFTIEFVNKSAGMPHNIVFVNSESDINLVGIAALEASEHEYIPQNELDRIFAYSGMAGPGETLTLTVKVPDEPGVYPYICTYPGHFTVMQGMLIAL